MKHEDNTYDNSSNKRVTMCIRTRTVSIFIVELSHKSVGCPITVLTSLPDFSKFNVTRIRCIHLMIVRE